MQTLWSLRRTAPVLHDTSLDTVCQARTRSKIRAELEKGNQFTRACSSFPKDQPSQLAKKIPIFILPACRVLSNRLIYICTYMFCLLVWLSLCVYVRVRVCMCLCSVNLNAMRTHSSVKVFPLFSFLRKVCERCSSRNNLYGWLILYMLLLYVLLDYLKRLNTYLVNDIESSIV